MNYKLINKRKAVLALLVVFLINFAVVRFASAASIMVHVPEKYTEVEAGERFYFEMEIKYPENPRRKDLRLNYEISKDGEMVAQSKVLKAIETQASFMDYIVIPESVKKGVYAINVKISDYEEELQEEVSASFYVVESRWAQLRRYFFILLGAIMLVGALVLINIAISKRR